MSLFRRRTEGEPHDRLTEIAAHMLGSCPEGVSAVVMLTGPDGDGGLALSGYNDDLDAVADVLVQAKAILQAHGKDLAIVPLEEIGRG